MELIKGTCTICNSSSLVITHKTSQESIELIGSIFRNDINASNFDDFKTKIKLCLICLYQIHLIDSKMDHFNDLSKGKSFASKKHKNDCFICESEKNTLKIDNSFPTFSKYMESYKTIDKKNSSVICTECYYVLNAAFHMKTQILQKQPSLKKSILRKTSMNIENGNYTQLPENSKISLKAGLSESPKEMNHNRKKLNAAKQVISPSDKNKNITVLAKDHLMKKLSKCTTQNAKLVFPKDLDKKFKLIPFVCIQRDNLQELSEKVQRRGRDEVKSANNRFETKAKRRVSPIKIKLKMVPHKIKNIKKGKKSNAKELKVKVKTSEEEEDSDGDEMAKTVPVKNIKIKLERLKMDKIDDNADTVETTQSEEPCDKTTKVDDEEDKHNDVKDNDNEQNDIDSVGNDKSEENKKTDIEQVEQEPIEDNEDNSKQKVLEKNPEIESIEVKEITDNEAEVDKEIDIEPIVKKLELDNEKSDESQKNIADDSNKELDTKSKGNEDFGSLIDEVQCLLNTSGQSKDEDSICLHDSDMENFLENTLTVFNDKDELETPKKSVKRRASTFSDSLSSAEKAKKKVRFNETVESYDLSD